MKLRAKLLITFHFIITTIAAQPICDVSIFTLRNGLAAHTISSIAQGNNGLMWFSTWNGLCCFDGYQFQTFRSNPANGDILATNRIAGIRTNSHDDIWCATYDHRLYLFDTHACRFRDISETIRLISGNPFEVRTCFPLANGRTWIVGRSGFNNYIATDSIIGSDNCIRAFSPRTKDADKGVSIMKVFLDQYGNEWVMTDKGLLTGDGRKVAGGVFDFFAEIGKDVFLATHDGKLLKLHGNSNRPATVNCGGATRINAMKPIGGKLLALATDRGVTIINPRTNATTTIALIDDEAKELFADSKSNLWVFGSHPGVYLIDKSLTSIKLLHATGLTYRTRSEKPFFHEDTNGTVWVVPTNETFSYYDAASGSLRPYSLQSADMPGIPLPRIEKHLFDQQGNLWFAGVHDLAKVCFEKQDIIYVPVDDYEETRALAIDHAGNTWIGMSSGEIVIANPQGNVIGNLCPDGRIVGKTASADGGHMLFSRKIYALMEDSRQRMWIGTKGNGLYIRSADGSIAHYRHDATKGSLPSDDIYDFDIAPDGKVWIATFGGGACIAEDNNGALSFHSVNGKQLNDFKKVRRITHTADGTMLLSTNNGLAVMTPTAGNGFKTRTFTRTNGSGSLLTSDVMQALVTRRGAIYVITMGGGIQRIAAPGTNSDSVAFEPIAALNRGEGMIQSAVEDGNGNIWIVRENSIDKYMPANDSVVSFKTHAWKGRSDYSEAQPFVTPDHRRIAVATIGGAIIFNPAQASRDSYKPEIVFTEVKYQGEGTTHPILNTNELDVSTDHRNLTIYFAALDYRDNRNISYAYKLDGIDRDWTYVSSSHSASFNNLPCGHLRLLVRSTNSDGVWTDNTRTLNIYSHPTFWETGWARLLYFAILCCLIALGIYIYNLRTKIREMVEHWAAHIKEMRERRVALANPEVADPDELFMRKLKSYMEQNIGDSDMKINDIAEAIGISRSVFQARLKELTGLTPIDYVKKARIDRACYLLRHSHNNINQIAYAVGYSDPKYFSRVFKKSTGMTPTEYKDKDSNE